MKMNSPRSHRFGSVFPLATALAAGALAIPLAVSPRLRAAGAPAAAAAAPDAAAPAQADPSKPARVPLTPEELALLQEKLPTVAAAMKDNGEQFKVLNTLARSGFDAAELPRARTAAQRMAKLAQYVGDQLAKDKDEEFLALNEQWWLTARKLEVAAQNGDATRADELGRELKTRCLNCHEAYNQ